MTVFQMGTLNDELWRENNVSRAAHHDTNSHEVLIVLYLLIWEDTLIASTFTTAVNSYLSQ